MCYYVDLMVNAAEKSIKKVAYIPMNNNYKNDTHGIENTRDTDDQVNDSLEITSERLYGEFKNSNIDIKHIKLDLSYITPNIIVCSYPICFSKDNLNMNNSLVYKKFYRNSLKDLVEYLNKKVGRNNWKIFNLKAEFNENEDYTDNDLVNLMSDTSVKTESPTKMLLSKILSGNNNTAFSSRNMLKAAMNKNMKQTECLNLPLFRCGWLDHCPPPLCHLIDVIDALDKYIKLKTGNVAVIHCKMGKGRSGCLVVGYLVKAHRVPLSKAIEVFKTTRFNYGIVQGVTIKSQLRYLHYYSYLIENHIKYNDDVATEFFLDNILINIAQQKSLPWLSDDIEYCKDYYFEVAIESYNDRLDNLNMVYTLKVADLLNKNCFAINTKPLPIHSEDIKVTLTLKLGNTSLFKTIGTKLMEKTVGMSSSFWINLKAESLLRNSKEFLISMPFEECDHLGDKIGFMSQSLNIINLFETVEIKIRS